MYKMHLWIQIEFTFLFSFFLVVIMEILQQIEDKFNATAEFSEIENRIYVKLCGVRNAYALKDFMEKNGFQDVYGTYEDSVYTLGFKDSELS